MTDGIGGYPSFNHQVALGLIPGWRAFANWNEQASITNTQIEMSNCGDNIRTLPTTATTITIASSSAEDGAGTTTGINSVRVYYIDANYDEKQEDVTLNGTGTVATTGTAIRFRKAHGLTVGSTGAAVGNITFTIDSNPQARILISQNETRESGFACPDDKFILLTSVEIETGRSPTVDADFAVEVRDNTTGIWFTVVSADVYQGAIDFADRDILLGPRDDIRVLAEASGAGGPRSFVTLHGYQIDRNLMDSMGSRYAGSGEVPHVTW